MHARTIAALLPRGTTGKICAKSPPKMTGILPKTALSDVFRISFKIRFTASMQYLYCIGTLSQIINDVDQIKSAS